MFDYHQPDERGHFGPYGGSFVAETLVHALDELKACYSAARADPAFEAEFRSELAHYVGRPSPVYHAARLSPPFKLISPGVVRSAALAATENRRDHQ